MQNTVSTREEAEFIPCAVIIYPVVVIAANIWKCKGSAICSLLLALVAGYIAEEFGKRINVLTDWMVVLTAFTASIIGALVIFHLFNFCACSIPNTILEMFYTEKIYVDFCKDILNSNRTAVIQYLWNKAQY